MALNFPSSLADAPAPAVPSPTAVLDLSRRIWARARPHPTYLSLLLLFYDVTIWQVNLGQHLLGPDRGCLSRQVFLAYVGSVPGSHCSCVRWAMVLSRFRPILAKNKIICRKVRVNPFLPTDAKV